MGSPMKYILILLLPLNAFGQVVSNYKGSVKFIQDSDTFYGLTPKQVRAVRVIQIQKDSIQEELHHADKQIKAAYKVIDTQSRQSQAKDSLIALKDIKIANRDNDIKTLKEDAEDDKTKIKFGIIGWGVAVFNGVLIWLTN